MLSSSRGQANFRGLEASRPRPRTSKSVLEDVLEAKDVLEDSTSGFWSANQGPNYCFLWTDTRFCDIFGMKTFFFFEITCFWPEKPFEFPISAWKSLWLFAPHLVCLIQTGINFLCPQAPLNFTQNKLLVPPPNLFLPPQSRYSGAGPGKIIIQFVTIVTTN